VSASQHDVARPHDVGVLGGFKRLLLGRALASHKADHQLLPKFLALPVFSSDALSSVAYATEEMMLVLVVAGAGALSNKIPLAIAVGVLLAVVVTSYRQTARAYPRGGGSYIVARENLGTIPGLVAAAAILIDYALTVAVSITAGTVAITSAAEFLVPDRVPIAIGLVLLVTLANLRGVKEAGTLFAIPTYGFVFLVSLLLAVGFARCLSSCPVAPTANLQIEAEATLGIFLLLRAFSSGATALTGVEAIADGVPAFRRPQAKNAATTLAIMGATAVTLFLGITVLAELTHVRVTEQIAASSSVLSQLGETVFGNGVMFIVLQVFTAGILILAANTAYQDFPRLSSILARDGFMPSQFKNRGDRLVFSNGVVILAGLAILLIWIYDAELTRLIQLYVVGVFTAFTLSQAGMVRHWFRRKGAAWRRKAVVNGVGAFTTGVVLMIVTVTKFQKGARIVVIAIPLIVLVFLAMHRHYARIRQALLSRRISAEDPARVSMVLLVPDLGPATRDAVAYLRAIRPASVTALFVGPDEAYDGTAVAWGAAAPRLGDLERLPQANGHLVRAVKGYLRARERAPGEFLTVVIPEFLTRRTMSQFLVHREAFLLKTSLLFEPGVVVTDVPSVPGERHPSPTGRPVEPERSTVIVPVAGVHDATVRAVLYARTLHPTSVKALYLVTDPEEVPGVISEWYDRRMGVPLVLLEAPFRDLGAPLLDEIRASTSVGDTIVTVVLPELVPSHWWENVLHNQTALFFKRLLLFEPNVVVTSVPFHLKSPETQDLQLSVDVGGSSGRSEP
jgi:amino acid transporter